MGRSFKTVSDTVVGNTATTTMLSDNLSLDDRRTKYATSVRIQEEYKKEMRCV